MECFTLKVSSPAPSAHELQSRRLALQDKQIDGINKCKVYMNELRMMFALRHRHIVRCPPPQCCL